MANKLAEQLYNVTVESFGAVCGLYPNPEAGTFSDLKPEFSVQLDFKGPLRGTLVMSSYGDLLSVMAEKMNEGEASLTDLQKKDSLKEMANIICGNILPYVDDPRAVFKIAAPLESTHPEALCQQASAQVVHAVFQTDQGRLDLHLILQP